jgi:hypothetical protein
VISFNQGFFRSEKTINDGPLILEMYYDIRESLNSYSNLNEQFLELLKMNKKLYRILEVQYKLSRALQFKWRTKDEELSGSVSSRDKLKRCVSRIIQ